MSDVLWKRLASERFRARPITTFFTKLNTFIQIILRFILGEHGARRVSRGSPFQLPARLADGLGLESGLEISRLISFAPSEFSFGIGSPASACKRQTDLGCNGQIKTKSPGFVKLPRPAVEKTLRIFVCD